MDLVQAVLMFFHIELLILTRGMRSAFAWQSNIDVSRTRFRGQEERLDSSYIWLYKGFN